MSLRNQLEERIYLPLRAAWAMKNGLSQENISFYTNNLLTDIDRTASPRDKTAIILGSTRATAFIVDTAIKAGHKHFIIVGGKPINNEHAAFTEYVEERLTERQLGIAHADPDQTEAAFAEALLLDAGFKTTQIQRYSKDNSRNTGANMRKLIGSGFRNASVLEFYALAGSARRAWMTARKEFGPAPVISVHNAYPAGVTPQNWFLEPVARAHMAGEAVKTLGDDPLYVRLGFAVNVDLAAESIRCRQYARATAQGKPMARPT